MRYSATSRLLAISGGLPRDFQDRADPADLPELMDEPCSKEDLAAVLRDLQTVNRLTLSYRPTLQFLERVLERHEGREMHVVDVGSGYGDMLRRIYGWATRRGVRLRLTGVDLNAQTAAIARTATAAAGLPEGAIEWRTGDAFAMEYDHAPDVVISSLMAHHLRDEEILRFLRWMEYRARYGWFINDLERGPVPALLFGVVSRLLGCHPFMRRDGPVSFRRAFRGGDWEQLLRKAEIPAGAVRVLPFFPARLCVERLR